MPRMPATVARLGGTCTVTGTKVGVPYAGESAWILVPATVDDGGRAVVVVEAGAHGVSMTRTPASGAAPEYTVRFDGAPVTGVLGAAAADDLYQLAAAGAAAVADGAVAGALALTASHVATREQFGRPLATFQAVAQHAADVYITSRTLHLAALSACWRLSSGRDAAHDADVAAYWLAAEAPAALRTCHHLHGGIGVDASYPLHRYSALVSDLARLVGGVEHRLDRLAGAPCSSS
jgi:3-oxo-4-pregnene-20-carboxyl-CoA dehydrogenase alpha subunit